METNVQADLCTQARHKSIIFWIGMANAIIVGLVGVFTASGIVTPEVGGAIASASAAVFAYCNGNNPSLKGL